MRPPANLIYWHSIQIVSDYIVVLFSLKIESGYNYLILLLLLMEYARLLGCRLILISPFMFHALCMILALFNSLHF